MPTFPSRSSPGEPKYTPEQDRRMLEMRATGLTYSQIGAALGTTPLAVKGRLRRVAAAARKQMKRNIEAQLALRIREQATARGVSEGKLIGMVMESVARHQLWDAIL